jgi:polyferredoxin/tetratricopeptide (TPR) repeat protein
MGRRRALVLVLVHVVIGIHIVQWLVVGMTVSPVEPSESMETLEHGVVNAGFVFFVLAIVSTLIFGRFFCGWGCHVVALQDLCGHLMRRAGIKPKPFRSRLLVFAPLVFGLYMFVWPSVKRVVVRPALAGLGIEQPNWLAEVADPHGLTNGFLVSDFWATFPAWYVAIPFLAVCGFAAVYFLGSKGFCTYGCPYGGIFAPADRVAPVRIRVTDACEQCGHCTATCTSNVRVHEEVRDFGMVVDPGCMKCMDCVSVCPTNALYLGIGRPALGAKPATEAQAAGRRRAIEARRRRYDLSVAEEVVFAGVFGVLFVGFRGMLDVTPMLMAIGLAGVCTFILASAWRVVRSANVRIQNRQLKLKGRIKPAGFACVALGAVIVLGAAWSGNARYHRWRSMLAYKGLDVPVDVALRVDFEPTPGERRQANAVTRHAAIADSAWAGGVGWALAPDARLQVAYANVLLGRFEEAEEALRIVIRGGRPLDPVVLQLGAVMGARGATGDEVTELYRDALERHPRLSGVREVLAARHVAARRFDEAIALHEEAIEASPDDADVLLGAARFYAGLAEPERVERLLGRVEAMARANPAERRRLLVSVAGVRGALGNGPGARMVLSSAIDTDTTEAGLLIQAAGVYGAIGDVDEATSLIARASEASDIGPGELVDAGAIFGELGRVAEARALLARAGATVGDDAWELARVAARLRGLAEAHEDGASLRASLALYERSVESAPESATIRHDYAATLFGAGRDEESLIQLERCCSLAPTRAVFPERLASMLTQLGRAEAAARWAEEADRRRQAVEEPE